MPIFAAKLTLISLINMKRRLTIFCLVLFVSLAVWADESYDVEEVYVKKELPRDAKIIDRWDNIQEAKYILLPADNLYDGKYEVSVTRIDANLYSVTGTDYIIQTKYCYEYAYYQKAVLVYENYGGYTSGKLTFVK